MAKAKKAESTDEESSSRKISISKRQVQVKNLNFSPEKNGEELVERADLSVRILLEEADLDALVQSKTDPSSTLLFDSEGHPALPECMLLPLDLQAAGALVLGSVKENVSLKFKSAKLKKCSVRLMFGPKAELACQFRVDPSGALEALAQLVISKAAILTFTGEAELPDDDDGQQDMDL